MKFTTLDIENCLAITKATFNLEDRGLVLIQGANHDDTSADSNGSGKSSIADALCWCWFGITARGVTGDDIINDKAGKNTRVSSTLVDGAITYTATRYRKHKTGKNTLQITSDDGLKTTDLTKGTEKLTQEVANRIIGSSLEVFTGSIYAGQEKMPDLPAMTDKGLKLLIEEAAGTTVLEAAYKEARDSLAASNEKLTVLNRSIEQRQEKARWIDSQIGSVRAASALWVTNQAAKIESVKSEIASVVVPAIRDLNAKIAAIDAAAISAAIAVCDAKIAAVGAEGAELLRLETAVVHASTALNAAVTNRARNLALLKAAQSNVSEVEGRLGQPCNECARPHTIDTLEDLTVHVTRKVDDYKKIEADFEAQEKHLHEALRIAQEARDAFKLTLTDVSAESSQRASLQLQIDAHNALLRDHAAKTTHARDLRDRFNTLSAEVNPATKNVEALEKELKEINDEIADITLKVMEQQVDVEVDAEVVKVYSPAGVRAHILDEVTPFLNTQTAKYLSTLSDDNISANWNTLTPDSKGVLKEKFTIDVESLTGGKTFRSLSGGEKRKVRIATALALQDLVATRASKPIDLFIGDEIDDALDPAGLERLTIILEEKARERGSVFVISHADLKDHIRHVVLIEKRGGETTVTEMNA